MQELEFALRTNEAQHDPLIDPNISQCNIPELENEEWRELTELAILHVYGDIIKDPSKYVKAQLGPEDIRWLKVMFEGLEG